MMSRRRFWQKHPCVTSMVEDTGKPLDILMGIIFYPRGGSAQVVRYLSHALRHLGIECTW